MSDVWTDWSVVLFFLVVLIAIRPKGREIRDGDPESYRGIVLGLGVLSVMALGRVYRQVGLLDGIPFVSEPLFFDLLYWIGVITGCTLMIAGVGRWLPKVREMRANNLKRIRRLELLNKVEQLVSIQNCPDSTLRSTIGLIVDQLGFEGGAVLKKSSLVECWQLIGTAGNLPDESDPGRLGSSRNHREPLRVPLDVAGREVAHFLLWNVGGEKVPSDKMRTLRRVTEILARQIQHDRDELRLRTARRISELRRGIEAAIAHFETGPKRFSVFARRLRRELPFQTMSLALWRQGSDRSRRFTANSEGRTLILDGVALPRPGSLSGPAFHAGRRLYLSSLPPEQQPGDDEILHNGIVGSLYALPLNLSPRYQAVLMMTFGAIDALRPRDLWLLSELAGCIRDIVWPDVGRLTCAPTGTREAQEPAKHDRRVPLSVDEPEVNSRLRPESLVHERTSVVSQ